jgi:two-component system KDP operon response regulator KdpE
VLAISTARRTATKARILVVDNDAQIRRLMRTTLVAQGFEVNEAPSGDEALERTRATKYDLIILDVNMPGTNGIETCAAIRSSSDVSIIMLTVRTTEKDKTEAFEAGADDYVTKPFSMPELLARVRASLRRRALPLEFERRRLRLGDIEVDFEAREVRGRKQQEKLTPKEFDLLSYLAAHANRVITHRELLKEVWGSDTGGEKEYLRVFINRLRKKIESEPDDPKYLLTEHWLGYRLRLPE